MDGKYPDIKFCNEFWNIIIIIIIFIYKALFNMHKQSQSAVQAGNKQNKNKTINRQQRCTEAILLLFKSQPVEVGL